MFASRFAGRVAGLVVHDKAAMGQRTGDLVAGLTDLGARLERQSDGPMLFLEYAAGLGLDWFTDVAERLREVPRVGACVDVGHVGIAEARASFSRHRPGLQLTGLQPADPRLPELAADVQAAAGNGAAPASLTLEIHQVEGRRPLADAAGLFRRWRDLTNAERMNHWLAVLGEHAALVTAALDRDDPATR